jgi:hypothetical protein
MGLEGMKRGAAGKIALQGCGAFVDAFKDGIGLCADCGLLRLLAPPVPCRAGNPFGQPRPLCGLVRADAMRAAPAQGAEAVALAAFGGLPCVIAIKKLSNGEAVEHVMPR